MSSSARANANANANAASPATRMPVVGDVLLGRFKLEAQIGEGGMGRVFRVRQMPSDQRFAMKVLAPEATISVDAIPRFLNEARAAMQLTSQHVVKVHELGTIPELGLPYILMELLEGADLAHLIERRSTLPIAEAVDYVIQACDAIANAHANGIIHRDLKPANLFLTSKTMAAGTSGSNIIKVLDFGISKMAGGPVPQQALTTTNAFLGSPHYMSPEQLKSAKDVDARADVWSLGVILYELLAGKPPFDGGAYGELFVKVMTGEYPPLGSRRQNVPEQLENVITCCLRKARDERFPNAIELVRALAPFASPEGVGRAKRLVGPSLGTPVRSDESSRRLLSGTAVMAERPASLERPISSGKLPAVGSALLPPLPLPPSQKEIATIPSSNRIYIGPPGSNLVSQSSRNAAWEGGPRVPATSSPLMGIAIGLGVFAAIGGILIIVALRARAQTAHAATSMSGGSPLPPAPTAISSVLPKESPPNHEAPPPPTQTAANDDEAPPPTSPAASASAPGAPPVVSASSAEVGVPATTPRAPSILDKRK